MSPDPLTPAPGASAERQPAVWPWLLLPLVALALFFALRAVKQDVGSAGSRAHPDTAVESSPVGDSGSR